MVNTPTQTSRTRLCLFGFPTVATFLDELTYGKQHDDYSFSSDEITYVNCALIEQCSSGFCCIFGGRLSLFLKLPIWILSFEKKKILCTYSLAPFLQK